MSSSSTSSCEKSCDFGNGGGGGNGSEGDTPHVLAVDDSVIERKLIERLLKSSEYKGSSFPFLIFPSFLC